MRRIIPAAAGWVALAITLTGCIVAPAPRPRPVAYYPPATYYRPPPPGYYRPPPVYYRPPPPRPPGVSIGVNIN